MNPLDVLRQFDRDMRADPAPEAGVRIERAGALVRAVSPGECCVIHADFLGHHRHGVRPDRASHPARDPAMPGIAAALGTAAPGTAAPAAVGAATTVDPLTTAAAPGASDVPGAVGSRNVLSSAPAVDPLTTTDAPDVAAAVDEAIAAELAYAQASGVSLEWKVFGHDWPSDLAARLEAAGFEADEPETLMVLALSGDDDGDGDDAAVAAAVPAAASAAALPDTCTIHRVTDADRLDDYATATRAAFGDADPERLATFRARLTDPALALFVAYADAQPVAAARLELPPARAFASLWGGGVAPTHRSRGLYRALVHHRAAAARARGYRYLTVDARATSRPILTRLGFVPLTTIRGWLAPRPERRPLFV